MMQMKTSVSLWRDGRWNEIPKTLSQALLTVALVVAAYLPNTCAQPVNCVLACYNAQVSLDEDCMAEVTYDMVSHTNSCPDGQFVVYVITLAGDTLETSPYVTESEIDQQLIVSVYDEVSGNSCWSYIFVEDKMPPMISCNCPPINFQEEDPDPDCIFSCLEAVVYEGPTLFENCPGDAQIFIVDEQFMPICHPDLIKVMIRKYVAVDGSGNMSDTCTEMLFLERIDFSQIEWPDSFTVAKGNAFLCDGGFLDLTRCGGGGPDGIPDAAPVELGGAGVPMINGVPIFPNFIDKCNAQIYCEDIVIGPIGCVKKVMRMWRAFEWHCMGENDTLYLQIIEIVDDKGPDLVCPPDVTMTTNTNQCEATVFIPVPFAVDNCNSVVQISVQFPGGFINNILSTGGVFVKLPVGENVITYTAYDDCYNSSQCQWRVVVEDHTPPVPICDAHTVVALTDSGPFGLTLVPAIVFDDGSYDDCGPVTFLARRMTSCIDFDWTTNGAGEDNVPNGIVNSNDHGTTFKTYVPFACCDVDAGPIMIELRVIDASGNINSCMVEVEVQDKLPPSIVCMNDITISCDFAFDPNNLSVFGSIRTDPADRQEICIFDPTNPNANGAGFVCIGLDGLATDNCEVTVTESAVIDMNACGTGLIIRTFVASGPGGADAICQQFIHITNFHPYFINDVTCHNVDPNDGVIWPCDVDVIGCGADVHPDQTGFPIIFQDHCDLVGFNFEDLVFPFVQGACFKILRTWRVIDWCTYGPHPEIPGVYVGLWEYKQVIKVLDTEAPEFLTDQPFISLCNEFNCDDLFVELIQSATDDCTPDEDLIWSYGIDFHNNSVINLTFSGTGNTINASRFFPIGFHRVIYSFEDGCGSRTTREQFIEILACKPPTPICINGLSATLMPQDLNNDGEVDWGMVVIWASDFDKGSHHACGYPVTVSFSPDITHTSMVFDCNHLGIQVVQIWVTDLVIGQQDFCTTWIDIQDNLGSCDGNNVGTGVISGEIATEIAEDVKDVMVELSGTGLVPVYTNNNGRYAFPSMPYGSSYNVTPVKNDDWRNGVSTLDLVHIQKHLLGMEQLDSPYKLIAADANRSNSISAIDIVILRQLILGIVDKIDQNTSWRFVDSAYDFLDPANPFAESFPESYMISPFDQDMPDVDFIAIKVGDVNHTVIANLNGDVTPRSALESLVLQIQDRELVPGEVIEIAVEAGQAMHIEGYQAALQFDPAVLSFASFAPGHILIRDYNMALNRLAEGNLPMSWSEIGVPAMEEGAVLFTLEFAVLAPARLSDVLSVDASVLHPEVYTTDGEIKDLEIGFIGVQAPVTTVVQEFELLENHPNPFSDYTMVQFITPSSARALLTIYDATGRVVFEQQIDAAAGLNTVEVKGIQATGVLYCQVSTDTFSATRKMIRME